MTDHLTEQLSKKDELQRDQIAIDLEAVLQLPHGRRLLWRILERCGVFNTAFTGDAASTNFKLGEQNIGLWLVSQMDQADATAFPRMILKRAEDLQQEKRNVHVLDLE